jgi:ribosomal protein L11
LVCCNDQFVIAAAEFRVIAGTARQMGLEIVD